MSEFIWGILASFVAWFLVAVMLKPRIRLDAEIQYEPTAALTDKIPRVRIRNAGIFTAYDVTVYGRLIIESTEPMIYERERTHVINIGNGGSPFISGIVKSNNNTKWYVISVPRQTSENLEAVYFQRYGGRRQFSDIYDIFEHFPDAVLRITVTSSQLFSGSRGVKTRDYKGIMREAGNLTFIKSNAYSCKNNCSNQKPNEDLYMMDRKNNIYMIFDGVSRDIADDDSYPDSNLVTEITKALSSHIMSFIQSALNKEDKNEDQKCDVVKSPRVPVNEILKLAIVTANEHISLKTSQHAFKPGAVGIVCVIRDGFLHYAYIGDCYGHIIRASGESQEFTLAQTDALFSYLDWHKEKYGKDTSLTKLYIRKHICNNPSSSLGYGVIDGNPTAMAFVEQSKIPLFPGDKIILATDGINDYLKTVIKNNASIEFCAKEIIELSNQSDAEAGLIHDDKTLMMIHVDNLP